tara:strand:+ start:4562 stop:4927 length:366 start_codon:yes stop_codon:yes gene_type:complete
MKRFWYFRNPSTIGADDAETGDSLMVPVEDVTGVTQESDTTVVIWCKPQKDMGGVGLQGAGNNDWVKLTVLTAKRREIMEALASAMNNGPHDEGITVIADDVTGTYLTSDISAVAGVNIAT